MTLPTANLSLCALLRQWRDEDRRLRELDRQNAEPKIEALPLAGTKFARPDAGPRHRRA